MLRYTRTAAALGLAIAGAALAGCGSSATSTGSAVKAAAVSQPSGSAIVIGSICSCSNPSTAASLGRSGDVIKAWADSVNASGGINGHPVKLIVADDGGDPAKSLQAAKTLVESDKVVAIVGFQSLQDASWAKYVASKGVPVVGGNPNEASMFTNPDFYPSAATLPMMIEGIVNMAKTAGAKTIGVMYCAESPVCAQAVPIVQGLAKLDGLQVVAQKVSASAPDYTAPCLAMKNSNASVVYYALDSQLILRVQAQCAQQGYRPLPDPGSGSVAKDWLTNSAVNGALVASETANYTDKSIPAVQSMYAALDKYAPGLTSSAQFSFPLVNPWAGGLLFQKAAEAAHLTPTSTPADVKRGLYALKNETLDGLAPPLTFTPGKPTIAGCYFPLKIASGNFTSTGNGAPMCLDAATLAKVKAIFGQ
jgi:branched-chain amino acid transport system substrate-binding protein